MFGDVQDKVVSGWKVDDVSLMGCAFGEEKDPEKGKESHSKVSLFAVGVR